MLIDRKDYPRPLLYREGWQSLNGPWDFAFDDDDTGLRKGWAGGFSPTRSINVPFSYETEASGIGDQTAHPVVWYQKRIDTHDLDPAETLLLHFEGSDCRTNVYANGICVCSHTGGYTRFTADLTSVLPNDSVLLVIRIEDSLSMEQPRGKQRYKSESWGCWYVQTTGIWKTVWLERVPRKRLIGFSAIPDPESRQIRVAASASAFEAPCEVSVTVYADGTEAAVLTRTMEPVRSDNGKNLFAFESEFPTIRRWCPEDPFLYEVKGELIENGVVLDTVWTYFGFRTIGWDRDGLLLNGKRTYLRMILDQGYWPSSGLTPPDTAALGVDLDAVVRYGYNGVRKHQKIEDERFLYLCDVRGILVFSEMAATYRFSEKAADALEKEWTNAVMQCMDHPSIVAWVPFNESWGIGNVSEDRRQQELTERIRAATKSLDPSRPVISNDGWEHTRSDIVTIHDYRETGAELLENHGDGEQAVLSGERSYSWYGQKLFAKGYKYDGQPLLLSEYGGIAFKTESGWGYGDQVEDEKAFLDRFLSQNEAIRKMPWFSGFCYTQLTDVEQEKNGLLTADRRDKLSGEGIEAVRKSNASFCTD